MVQSIELILLGGFFVVGAFRMTSFGYGPARSGNIRNPPNLAVRLIFGAMDLVMLGLGVVAIAKTRESENGECRMPSCGGFFVIGHLPFAIQAGFVSSLLDGAQAAGQRLGALSGNDRGRC